MRLGKVNSFYNYFFEALDGKAPEGKELVKNVSRRKDNDPVKDRQYYLYLAESFNSYANGAIVINSRGEYPGFRAMPEYSDGHYGSISGGKIGIWFRYHANWTKANQLVDENGNGINYWGEENPVNVYFTRNSYKLNFEIKDGPKVKSDGETLENDFAMVKYEKELKQYAPSNYEKGKTKYTSADGRTYTFEGWYTGSDYTMKYDFNDTMPSHDVTLYAKWKPNSLKVTFRTNSEKVKDSSKEVVYGEKVEKPQNPEKDGHVFLGWTLKDKPFSFASPINEDIELVANWRSVKTYWLRSHGSKPGFCSPVGDWNAVDWDALLREHFLPGDVLLDVPEDIVNRFSDSLTAWTRTTEDQDEWELTRSKSVV